MKVFIPKEWITDNQCVVGNPINCNDFKWLQSEKVSIDGQERIVKGVERFAHTPPYLIGENIVLHLKEVK